MLLKLVDTPKPSEVNRSWAEILHQGQIQRHQSAHTFVTKFPFLYSSNVMHCGLKGGRLAGRHLFRRIGPHDDPLIIEIT